MTDASGSTQYCYNRFGDLVRKVQTTHGQMFTLRYAYTQAGRLSAVTYPDGAIVDYVRNALGQATEVGVTPAGGTRQILLNQATYYPFGPSAGWTYGNGRSLSRSYDQDYLPQAILDGASGGLDLGYGFDAVGNLDTLATAQGATPLLSFGYDSLSRLTQTQDGTTGTPIETYAYDATGNRTSFENSAGIQAYVYPTSSHRLQSIAGIARTYDAAGNTASVSGTAQEFVYDNTGRMRQAKSGGNVVASYAYNGKGERVRKTQGAADTYTLYDEAGRWLGDYNGSGTPLQQAIWLDDLPVGLMAGTNQALHYVEPDHLGTPRAVIDPVRNVAVWKWDAKSEAFGDTPPSQDPDADGMAFVLDLRFPGQRYDSATGLNYNYFRDYEPGAGRYVQSDPLGLSAGPSTYAYVGGNPISRIDPLGLDTLVIVGGPSDGNLFGHIAIAFTGRGVYSYGTKEGLGTSVTTYLQNQSAYRSSVVYRLSTTPQQEARMLNRILSFDGKSLPDPRSDLMAAMKDTCATRTADALGAGGISTPIPTGPTFLPGSVGGIGAWNASSFYFLPQGGIVPSTYGSFNP